MDKDIWYKILNRPDFTFRYEEPHRKIYEETKKRLRKALSTAKFLIECDNQKLVIKVWKVKI